MSIPPVSVSVIIASYNRAKALSQTLEFLALQEFRQFEVILVEQVPNGIQGCEFPVRHGDQFPFHHLRVSWNSLPRARNVGLENASGDIVVFIDDDVILPPRFLGNVFAAFVSNPEAAGLAGCILDPSQEHEMSRLSEIDIRVRSPAVRYDRTFFEYYLDEDKFRWTQGFTDVWGARGCNMAFRLSFLKKCNLGFDEKFGGHSYMEESDFCMTLREQGGAVIYDPSCVLVHLADPVGGCRLNSKRYNRRSAKLFVWVFHNAIRFGLKHLSLPNTLYLVSSELRRMNRGKTGLKGCAFMAFTVLCGFSGALLLIARSTFGFSNFSSRSVEMVLHPPKGASGS